MNKAILSVLLVFVVLTGSAQESRFSIISSTSYNPNYNNNYLLDYQGNIIGNYEGYFYKEKPAELFVIYQNKRMPVQKPLGMFIAVPEADRFFNYGVEPGFYTDYNLELHILKTDGTWIKNVGVVGHAPYAVAASSTGDFYAFTHVDIDSIHSLPYLKKINKNGNIEWEVRFTDGIPLAVYISPDGQIIAAVYLEENEKYFVTEFYNQRGSRINTLEHSESVGGIEFVNEKQFIIAEANRWTLYKMDKGFNKIFSGQLRGTTFCKYPVSLSPDKEYFIIVSLGEDNSYQLSAISLKNGSRISDIKINEEPFWEAYRMAVFESKDLILLRTGKQLVKLQLSR